MTERYITHDGQINAFADAGGAVENATDESVTFNWDERHVVTVDAPADLESVFDTNDFYKIEDATIARPIKQRYFIDGELKTYVKPPSALRKAAWSFDNSPYTLTHPNSGFVKDINDVHGFWRGVYYDEDDAALRSDLYIPITDNEALSFIEENEDVSIGFANRVVESADAGPLIDNTDDVDGYQVDIFGNHIAGVERGRCPSEKGCGLDSYTDVGYVYMNTDVSYSIVGDSDTEFTTDYRDEDGQYFAVAPDENPDDEPKFPINSCSDVQDAWHFAIRERGDISISFATLKERIQSKARDLGCDVPTEMDENEDSDCGCGTTDTTMDNEFDIPDVSLDALAEENDAVAEVIEQRDEYEQKLEERRKRIDEAFDSAENFTIELDDDECRCDGVKQLVTDLDETVDEVEDLRDELTEYRSGEIEEKLDTLAEYGADRDEWEETVDDADNPIETLDEEIERREEIAESMDTSVKVGIDSTTTNTDADNGSNGTRSYGRGYAANSE